MVLQNIENSKKPRLIYFQWRHGGLPAFLKLHIDLHVKCLSEFFEVIVVAEHCDYARICEKHTPDITLFESGYRSTISKRIQIKNPFAFAEIPKVGLHNGDPWCDCRVGFLSDMEEWGIETFFSISTTMAEHSPEIADNLYVWPNFIDSEIYRDYGMKKNIPIMFNGHINPLYPWRQEVYNRVSRSFPCLTYPHLGYENHSSLMINGKEYAEALNASWFVPTCGTLAKEVVRKHFEIPGSKACLITEESEALLAAGFRDMENCVFASPNNISDKLNFLFEDREKLNSIIGAGYNLVHSSHTLKQRNQIYQWYILNKQKKSNEKIIQFNPFGSLKIIENSNAFRQEYIKGNGLNLELLSKGNEKLREGKYEEAEVFYLKCLNYIYWMPEPKLKLTICSLLLGKAERAHNLILEPIENNFGKYNASSPDPVEWAYLIICLLCKGDLSSAAIRADQFPGLKHPELNRTRWLVTCLNNFPINSPCDDSNTKRNRSIHILDTTTLFDWTCNIEKMFRACDQQLFAERIVHFLRKMHSELETVELGTQEQNILKKYNLENARIQLIKQGNAGFRKLNIPKRATGLPSASISDLIIRLGKKFRINQLTPIFRRTFVPINSKPKDTESKGSDDERDVFDVSLLKLLISQSVKTILLFYSKKNCTLIDALLTTVRLSNLDTKLFILHTFSPETSKLKEEFAGVSTIIFYEISYNQTDGLSPGSCMRKIKEKYVIENFDLTVIEQDGNEKSNFLEELEGAKWIILSDINKYENFKLKELLSSRYEIISQDPMHIYEYAFLQILSFRDKQTDIRQSF